MTTHLGFSSESGARRARRFCIPPRRLRVEVAGFGGHLCSVSVERASTVARLKDEVESATGVPAACQRLVSETRELADATRVTAIAPQEGGRLFVTMVRTDPDEAKYLQIVSARTRGGQQGSGCKRWLQAVAKSLCESPPSTHWDREADLAAVARSEKELGFAAPELQDLLLAYAACS